MSCLLITGSSGFVGRPASLYFDSRGFSVRAFSRNLISWPSGIEPLHSSSLSSLHHSSPAFVGVDCVLHFAGRAHIMRETSINSISLFRHVNAVETLRFARQAALAGVRRFVFLSTIKVNGEFSLPHCPFTENDTVNPLDPYAVSKFEAELGLSKISSETGMEIVIVRPPLIYGPAVKGNFRAMMKNLSSRTLLPLGSITNNQRSLIALDNLLDFLYLCVIHPEAAGRLFLVSDQQDVSTAELLELLAESMGLTARLFPVPQPLLFATASLLGKRLAFTRLCRSLSVDSSLASSILGWLPPLSLEEGLRRASTDFLS